MQTIQQAIAAAVDYCNDESCGDTELVLHNDYSGRGMYGAKCIGVAGEKDVILEMIAYIIQEAHAAHVSAVVHSTLHPSDESEEAERVASNFANSVVNTLLDFSEDSMGRDTVIVYWENVNVF